MCFSFTEFFLIFLTLHKSRMDFQLWFENIQFIIDLNLFNLFNFNIFSFIGILGAFLISFYENWNSDEISEDEEN